MKKLLSLLACLAIGTAAIASDLPTVSIDHLYYLASRGERIGKLKADEMVDYRIALKLGRPGFENLYAQLFKMRIDLTKFMKVEEILPCDPRIITLNKTVDA